MNAARQVYASTYEVTMVCRGCVNLNYESQQRWPSLRWHKRGQLISQPRKTVTMSVNIPLKSTTDKGCTWMMPSFWMWRHGALVRTDVSEEHVASIITVNRIRELETALLVSSNALLSSLIHFTLMMGANSFFETFVLTRATRRTSQRPSSFIATSVKTSNFTKH
jgi:hypothetical protein